MIENQVHNQAITGSNPQINIQNLIAENINTVEEIIVPVVTAEPNSKQYVIIKEVKKEEIPITNNEIPITNNGTMSVNDQWSQNSLFPELNVQFPKRNVQDEDLDLTAHNPLEVTGQVNKSVYNDVLMYCTQGHQKRPQSGWARPKIIILVVKSGWAYVLFSIKIKQKSGWARALPASTPLLYTHLKMTYKAATLFTMHPCSSRNVKV